MNSKVVIIGAGSVGTTIAYAMMIKGIARKYAIVDINTKKAQGEALDLNHGKSFIAPAEVYSGSYKDCADADIIIITAGAKQKPGESRINLVERNLNILKHIITDIKKSAGKNQPILLIVSNPCDILTYFAYKFSGYPENKVFGSGTVLDSSRLRFEIANKCNLDPRNVHGYIVGEHGDSEVVLWSSVRLGSLLFGDYCQFCETHCGDEDHKGNIEEKVRKSAYVLIESKGFTNFAVGLAVAKITEAILRNENTILPVSVKLNGQYDISDVALSIPCIVNHSGIKKKIIIEMTPEEKAKLTKSADALKEIIQKFKSKYC